MGKVYRAFDTRLQRRVALKILHEAQGEVGAETATALREARAAAAIAHPNATAIYDASQSGGVSFIVMELVNGTSLRAVVNAGVAHVPLNTRLRWLIDVSAALSAAHRTGIVHRDVKPENVMVADDGMVKVLDFGVAGRTYVEGAPDPSGMQSGARVAGTPAYMAPEQIRGEPLDGRADQFGWAVLAYELCTGKLPWLRAKDVLGYIAAVVGDDPEPMRSLDPVIPPEVDAAILRALSKDRERRYPGMTAVAADLAPFARGSLMMAAVDASSPALVRGDPPSNPGLGPPIPIETRVREYLLDRESSLPAPPPSPPPSGPRAAPRPQPVDVQPVFRAPDFEARVDLAAHIRRLPPDATCKGLFFIDLVQRAAPMISAAELCRNAWIPERRYLSFRDYPMGEHLRLLVAAARAIYPRVSAGEALRRLGQTTFDAILATHIGRSLFDVLGKDVEQMLLAGPRALKLLVNVGQVTSEKAGHDTFLYRMQGFPVFVETYQVGMLEGMLRCCARRGRIRVALADVANATIEIKLL
jgi:serine/threonine-protein kinase